MTTVAFPAPEDLPMQTYTEGGEMKTYRDRNYDVSFENSAYSVQLSLYGPETSTYVPVIPNHEYVWIDGYNGGDEWSVDNITTKIIDKATNVLLDFNKGSVTTTYANGKYTIEGKLVTSDNKAFNFKFTGSYISSPSSGSGIGTATDVIVNMLDSSHALDFKTGKVVVTKDGDIYTIVIEMPLVDGRQFHATYVGAIIIKKDEDQ